ncbi:MAG: S-methyl-5'-thioadenosine phosphorylase [Candidatus Pacearchaeota archaeon]|jgi:5'-methylthioadenosine phosphorylase
MVRIGIIGGSGLDDPKLLSNYEEKDIDTKYGKPSSKIICGKMNGVDVCILARHGKDHSIPPSQINYRANITALKLLGCDYILATSAVGSLRQEIKPGDLVFPDQFIDFTKQRKSSFFDEPGNVVHPSMSEPYSRELRNLLIKTSEELGFSKHNHATMVIIEGPRFSTKAESFMFKNFADIIGMTGVPECNLANEVKIPYASIAMSTDYDCWKNNEEPVTFEMVLERMKENADKVKELLIKVILRIGNKDSEFIKSKIRTIPNFPKLGIMFRDITTLIKDKEGFEKTINIFYERYKDKNIDVIAGIESRGFIFGSVLAHRLGVGFVPIRKPGKLPYEKISYEYDTEYSKDKIEMHSDAIKSGERVLLIDDLIATGGTACAACNLIEKLGGEIVECGFVVDLPALHGKEKLNKWKVYSIVEFEGE